MFIKVFLLMSTVLLIAGCDDQSIQSVDYKPVCEDCVKVQVDEAYQEPFNCIKDMDIKNVTYVFKKDFIDNGSLTVYGNYDSQGEGVKRIEGYKSVSYDSMKIGRANAMINYENGHFILTMPEKGLKMSPKDYTSRLGDAVANMCESAQEYKQQSENTKAWKKVE